MDPRRCFFVLLAVTGVLTLYIGRLFWLQGVESGLLWGDGGIVRESVSQRTHALVLDSGRGQFVDRHGVPLTGKIIYTLVADPSVRLNMDPMATEISSILRVSRGDWQRFVARLEGPALWRKVGEGAPMELTAVQLERLRELQPDGVWVVPYRLRYTPPYPASQTLGFVGQFPERVRALYPDKLRDGTVRLDQSIGVAGLEQTLEPLLRSRGSESIVFPAGRGGGANGGREARIRSPQHPLYPVKVVTTLDRELQIRIEQLLAGRGIKEGAAVLLDADNADVLAMASMPRFNPDKRRVDTDAWTNRALQATVPGSVFKTVVAAAALDEGLARPEEGFECHGALGEYGFSCWLHHGHGRLTFREAFAQSCNVVFAQVMQRIPSRVLDDYAVRLGIGRKIGWSVEQGILGGPFHPFAREEAGTIFAGDATRTDEGARLQTAIGQRDVRLSPLQATNLVTTLLNDGRLTRPRILEEIRYFDGSVAASFPVMADEDENAVSPGTARTLLRWMREVVVDGTGRALIDTAWEVAGKSGTAELGMSGEEGVNEWFVGYGPVRNPRYVLAVMVRREGTVHSEGHLATTMFEDVMNDLYRESK